jgi:hypothetical protein
MKTSIQESFAPITIQITLETPQELHLYQMLVGATLTVPAALFAHDLLREKQLQNLMKQLQQTTAHL